MERWSRARPLLSQDIRNKMCPLGCTASGLFQAVTRNDITVKITGVLKVISAYSVYFEYFREGKRFESKYQNENVRRHKVLTYVIYITFIYKIYALNIVLQIYGDVQTTSTCVIVLIGNNNRLHNFVLIHLTL